MKRNQKSKKTETRFYSIDIMGLRSLNQSKNGTESMVPHTEFQEQKPLPQPALTGGLQVGKANVI